MRTPSLHVCGNCGHAVSFYNFRWQHCPGNKKRCVKVQPIERPKAQAVACAT